MLASFFGSAIYYLTDGLIVVLLAALVYKNAWRRLSALTGYLLAIILLDGVGRGYFLHTYGLQSLKYYYFYWLTDVALGLGAFILVCTFFRRACAEKSNLWRHVRIALISAFVLVLGITAFSLSKDYSHLYSRIMVELQQNLYFTCLVLNTALYILMQQIQVADEELNMLVTGMGMQFAGPAASFALKWLTPGLHFTTSLMVFIGPICTLGMLLTWFYAIARMPKPAKVSVPARRKLVPITAGISLHA